VSEWSVAHGLTLPVLLLTYVPLLVLLMAWAVLLVGLRGFGRRRGVRRP
jgi:hypothetical protein